MALRYFYGSAVVAALVAGSVMTRVGRNNVAAEVVATAPVRNDPMFGQMGYADICGPAAIVAQGDTKPNTDGTEIAVRELECGNNAGNMVLAVKAPSGQTHNVYLSARAGEPRRATRITKSEMPYILNRPFG